MTVNYRTRDAKPPLAQVPFAFAAPTIPFLNCQGLYDNVNGRRRVLLLTPLEFPSLESFLWNSFLDRY